MPADGFREVTPAGELKLHLHAGQIRAWRSPARDVLVLSGTQSGKTSFGPHWLYREIGLRGPGDYMTVTPTFRLLELKALPEFRTVFEDILALGTYKTSPIQKFTFSRAGQVRTFGRAAAAPCTVFFGHAANPESLESATLKGLWCDEAGQKTFRLGSYEALQRRTALHRARRLWTTTPYDLGWLKQKLFDPAKAGDPTIDIVNFASNMNPAFPPEEFEEMRRKMQGWRFRMFYLGLFERPAGLIYDSFNETLHKIPRVALPAAWPRYLGLDFGGVHTAGVFYAEDPATGRLYAYREYLAGGRTAKEHVAALLAGEPGIPQCVGGSKSEDQWRAEFRAGGLPVRPPAVKDVEVGIDRVAGCHRRGELFVFDDLSGYLDQKSSYSRVLDASGEPTEAIEAKETYHFMDAERYILGWLRPAAPLQVRYTPEGLY